MQTYTTQFLKLAQKLKFVKRKGWTRFPQIQDVESVADHSWMISLITLTLPDSYNKDLCMKIAIVHDLAEVIVGDITPADNVPAQKKKEMELEALKNMVKEFDDKFQNEVISLFKQYEEGSSEEAQIVRDLDKYEMMLMAFQYEQKYNVNLDEFFKSAAMVKSELIQKLLQQLIEERNEFNKNQQQ